MGTLSGKTAVITGASSGIGEATARRLAGAGARVMLVARRAERLEALANELGNGACFVSLDLAHPNAAQALLDTAEAQLGAIDILVNNAGITKDNLLLRMSEDDFNRVIQVNLNSVFNLTKSVQRVMLKQRSGSIINMASVVGVKGNAGQSNYAASKAGIIGFTKSIALELGSRNIRSNAIAPGFIETEMTAVLDEKTVQGWRDGIPLKRGGQPEDVANACVFLASDLSSYITGQVLNVDGGLLT